MPEKAWKLDEECRCHYFFKPYISVRRSTEEKRERERGMYILDSITDQVARDAAKTTDHSA